MTKDNKNELKRLNINIPSRLLERVKEYADDIGINTTSAFIVLVNQALEQKETVNALPTILEIINQAKDMQKLLSDENDLED